MESSFLCMSVLVLNLVILGVVTTSLLYVAKLFYRGDRTHIDQMMLIKQIADRHEHMVNLLASLTNEVLQLRQTGISKDKH